MGGNLTGSITATQFKSLPCCGGTIFVGLNNAPIDCSDTPIVYGVTGNIHVGTMPHNSRIFLYTSLGADLTIDECNGGIITVYGFVKDTATVTIGNMAKSETWEPDIDFGVSSDSASCDIAGDLVFSNGIPADSSIELFGAQGANSSIDMNSGGVGGTLTLWSGGAGTITNGGTVASGGTVTLADTHANQDREFSGTATFGAVSSGGKINTTGGTYDGELSGTLNITNTMAGDIDLGGTFSGVIDIGSDLNGDATFSRPFTGDLQIGGDVSGDIDVTGDVTATGSIDIGGGLRGRILVDGVCDGDINIDEGSTSVALIHIEDGFDGSILTGTDLGSYAFAGDMLFGPASSPSLPDYSFLGCVDIDGSLDGDIDVVACLDVDPAICVQGDTNGTITLTQTGCTPTYVLDSSCPTCP